MIIKPIHIKLSYSNHILIVNWVDDEVVEGWCDNVLFTFLNIQLKDIHSEAKGRAHCHKDEEEEFYIFDRLFDKPDVKRCLLEKLEPVKHLYPKKEDSYGSHQSQGSHIRNVYVCQLYCHSPRWEKVGVDIDQIYHITEIVTPILPFALYDFNVDLIGKQGVNSKAEEP